MKQTILRVLYSTIVNTGKAVVWTIKVINSRPAQIFWAPAFAYAALSVWAVNPFGSVVLFGLCALSTMKLLFSPRPTVEETVEDTRVDDATKARRAAIQSVVDEANEIVSRYYAGEKITEAEFEIVDRATTALIDELNLTVDAMGRTIPVLTVVEGGKK